MKKILLLTLYIAISTGSFSQERPAEHFLTKAKKQNTVAWVLLGGGFTFTAAGFIGGNANIMNQIVAGFNGEQDKGFRTSNVFFILGISSMLSSIPFFVASSGNRKKTKIALAPKYEKILSPARVFPKRSFPALAVEWKF